MVWPCTCPLNGDPAENAQLVVALKRILLWLDDHKAAAQHRSSGRPRYRAAGSPQGLGQRAIGSPEGGSQMLFDSVNRLDIACFVQLAIASNRVPVWPDVACNSLWLDNDKAAAQRKGRRQQKKWMAEDWRGDIEILPRLPLDGPPSTHRCLVWYYYEQDCDLQVTNPKAADFVSRNA